MLKKTIKKIVYESPFLRDLYKKKAMKKDRHIIERVEDHFKRIEVAEKVLLNDNKFDTNFLVGIVKDGNYTYVDEEYVLKRAYYPKYERFLKNNNIRFEYYDISASNWIEEAYKFDLIVWHLECDAYLQNIAMNKIYTLDKVMNKKCLPSFEEIWSNENKINCHYLYKIFNLPEIPTFVSHSRSEILNFINETKYPIISKLTTSACSQGVEKINNKREALSLVNKVFSPKGRTTHFAYKRQKGYVYFQEFVNDSTYDLRVIIIDNMAFGYYRYPNKGDFRASGSGNYKKKEIPKEALNLAFKVKEIFGSTCLSTDLLYSEKQKKYYIIESTVFISVDTPSQLEINGLSGYYKRVSENEYVFTEGKYWIQELTLKTLFKSLA